MRAKIFLLCLCYYRIELGFATPIASHGFIGLSKDSKLSKQANTDPLDFMTAMLGSIINPVQGQRAMTSITDALSSTLHLFTDPVDAASKKLHENVDVKS